MTHSIGFIGTGQMATALAAGLTQTQTIPKDRLFGYDVNPEAVQHFAKATGAGVKNSIADLVAACQVVFLAVKPQQMGDVLHQLSVVHARSHANPLWITIAAGMPIKAYLKDLGTSARLIRVMPNTACLVGEGVCGFCLSEGATEGDAELATSLLSTVGIALRFPERQLDAVTGLSGSGPAYVYMMIEAMADGAVKMGLARDVALQLAAKTVFGSAKVVLETGEHPAVLKDRVCSPRGTTISAVHTLEQHGFRDALISAVESATLRSKEMGANE